MVFGLVVMLAVLPIGILGDRVGRKSILTLAIALGIVMAIAVTFAQTLTHALLAAAFMATPFAALMSVGYAFLLDLVPEGRTAEFVGLSILTVAAAQIVGPILGGLLIDVLGYRAIFPAASLNGGVVQGSEVSGG
jgi:predicted MFS family arabinose efflux permease